MVELKEQQYSTTVKGALTMATGIMELEYTSDEYKYLLMTLSAYLLSVHLVKLGEWRSLYYHICAYESVDNYRLITGHKGGLRFFLLDLVADLREDELNDYLNGLDSFDGWDTFKKDWGITEGSAVEIIERILSEEFKLYGKNKEDRKKPK